MEIIIRESDQDVDYAGGSTSRARSRCQAHGGGLRRVRPDGTSRTGFQRNPTGAVPPPATVRWASA